MKSPGRSSNGGRRWLGLLAISALAALAGLLIAEGALRLAGLAPTPGLFTVTEAEFRRIPGTFAPGQTSVEAEGTAFEHRVTINNLGYRGPDLPLQKPTDETRILFAGDSFTWGHNVEDHETLPARLQERLRATCGPTSVINAGFSGTSILAQQAIVERGLAVDPDLVIVMYHENDIDELIHSRIWEQLAANRRVKSRFPVSLVYPVVRTSALWNLAQHARRVIRYRNAAVEDTRADGQPEQADVQAARSEYVDRLRAVRDLLSDRRIPFVFVTFPHPSSVETGEGGRDYDWIVASASDLGIATLDLKPHLESGSMSVEEAYLVPDDYHPSPAGHAFASEVLAAFIEREASALGCS